MKNCTHQFEILIPPLHCEINQRIYLVIVLTSSQNFSVCPDVCPSSLPLAKNTSDHKMAFKFIDIVCCICMCHIWKKNLLESHFNPWTVQEGCFQTSSNQKISIKTNYSNFRAWSSNKFEIVAFFRQSYWLECLLWFLIG